MNTIIEKFTQALLEVDRISTQKIMDDHVNQIAPVKFIEKIVVPSLEHIGEGWKDGNYALSQVYMSARICENLIDEILPPGDPDRKNQPKIAICVLCDHHKLGKIIVYSLLRSSGFDVMDFGVVTVDELVDRVKEEEIKILMISVLMYPSALKIRSVRKQLTRDNVDVKIIVGGAPFRFDEELWKQIGADAVGRTATEVISLVEKLTGDL